jgi:two-component system, LytTR family, sensor kinase
MPPGRLNEPELAAANSPSITLGSGRVVSKASLFIVLQVGGWLAACAVCALAVLQKFGFWPGLLNTFVWAVCGFVVTLGLRRVCRWARWRHHSHLMFAAIALCACLIAAPLWYTLEQVTWHVTMVMMQRVPTLWPTYAPIAASTAHDPYFVTPYDMPFYSIILILWASLYYGVNAILELESERAIVANALKLADTARLRALQSNLNPHFLFNALNGIATLVREQDAVTAAAMVDALSTFLRSTLQRLDTPELRVEEEIELIEQYLRIQRYRFGTRLRATVNADPEALSALIPTLILQPLVENAVRYSVLPREAGGCVWVSMRRELQNLVVTVEDDGPGPGSISAFGMGLQNSSERLTALYGAAASLTIGSRTDGSGCAVVIRIPLRPAPARQQSWNKGIEPALA